MDVGDAVHASDLTLPRGTTLQVEPDTLVMHVIAPAALEAEAAAEGDAAAEVPAAVPAEASAAAASEGE
jgi:large subunit ribosomal protein L25